MNESPERPADEPEPDSEPLPEPEVKPGCYRLRVEPARPGAKAVPPPENSD